MAVPERPEDVELEDIHRFLCPWLTGSQRVLDVGCGNGPLARRLLQDGLEVTALDRSLQRTERSEGIRFLETDFLLFEDAPYDALLFSASLHHLFPLEEALATAGRLLRPGGLVLVADFDLNAPDRETARWYYDMEGLLLAAGLYRADKVRGTEADDPLARWYAEHEDTPPLHSGSAMLEAVARHFTLIGSRLCPYLYRQLAGGLEPTPRGTALATWALSAEKRRIEASALKPVGLQLWARKAFGR